MFSDKKQFSYFPGPHSGTDFDPRTVRRFVVSLGGAAPDVSEAPNASIFLAQHSVNSRTTVFRNVINYRNNVHYVTCHVAKTFTNPFSIH